MATEKRLIDANDVYALFSQNGMARLHVADIDAIPRVDAVEVVHGRWKKAHIAGYLKCNCCEDAFIYEEWLKSGKWNYCPNCGAKMDGDLNG